MHSRSSVARNSNHFAKPSAGSALSRLLSVVPIATLTIAAGSGCLDGVDEDPVVSETSQAATVSTYTTSGCSTAVVLGLAKQIADEISCGSPTALTKFTP